jgi:hypothetical protein
MRRGRWAVLVAPAVLATLVSCSGSSSAGRQAEPGTTAASAAAPVFHRLGYSFVAPRGWVSREGSADWASVDGPPRLGSSAFDAFVPASADPRILVGKRPVGDSAGLDQWIARMRAGQLITYADGGCNAAEDQRPATLGGGPAVMVAFHCPTDGPTAGIVQFLARHGDSGWVVQCFSGDGVVGPLAGFEKQCATWLASFRFEP